jgi:hypothetical protein
LHLEQKRSKLLLKRKWSFSDLSIKHEKSNQNWSVRPALIYMVTSRQSAYQKSGLPFLKLERV